MIARLKGILIEKSPEAVIIDVHGVGFEVLVSLATLYELPEPGHEVRLTIHTHVRENQVLLLGFLHEEEKEAFRLLTTVNGIGPRLALNILSGLPTSELLGAIVSQDAQGLQRIPGVGKKTAERIVVELKDKIPPRDLVLGSQGIAGSPDQEAVCGEVLSALLNLGYKRKESEAAVRRAVGTAVEPGEMKLESLLKLALRELAGEG